MKKTLVVGLLFAVSLFAFTGVATAIEITPKLSDPVGEVLAVTKTIRPAALPKVLVGQEINFKETVNGDLVVAGGGVNLTSIVNGNVLVTGGTVNIGGVINGNLTVVGGEVILSGEVKGNTIPVGGSVKLADTGIIGGYLLSAGGQVDVLGKIGGDTRLAGGKVSVGDDSQLAGSLSVDGSEISVSERARITGEKQISEVRANKKMPWGYWRGMMDRPETRTLLTRLSVAASLVSYIGQVLLLLVLVKVLGKHIPTMTKVIDKSIFSTMGLGLAKLFLTPLLVILLMATVIGLPLSFVVLGVYFAAIFASSYLSAMVIGEWMKQRGHLKTNIYLQSIAGLAVIEVIGLIPVLGFLVRLLALFAGLGLVVRWEKSLLMPSKTKKD